MLKRILILAVTVIVTGCVSTGSPLDKQNYAQAAASAPNKLTADATYTPYVPAAVQSESLQGSTPPATDENTVLAGDIIFENGPAPEEKYDSTQYTTSTVPPVAASPKLPPLKAAILLPLSGSHGDLGQSMLQAAQMALFDMGYEDFELMPRDTKGTPQGASAAMQSAINDGAQIVLGPLFSDSVKAVKSQARRSNINMLAFSTDWTLAGDNTYIMGFLPFAQVQRVTEYAMDNGYSNIAVLAPNTDYGNAVISAFNSVAYRNGNQNAKVVRYTPGGPDSSSVVRSFTGYDSRVQQVNDMRAALESKLQDNPKDPHVKAELAALQGVDSAGTADFDAVLLPVGGDEARSVANMLSYYDLDPNTVKRLGTGLWDDSGLATEPALKDAWFAASEPGLRADFEQRYRGLYGIRPQRLATLAYDATALTAVIAKSSYYSRGAVRFERADFMNPNGFAGIDGIFRFRPDGLVERGLAVLQYKDSRIEVLEPAQRTFQKKQY